VNYICVLRNKIWRTVATRTGTCTSRNKCIKIVGLICLFGRRFHESLLPLAAQIARPDSRTRSCPAFCIGLRDELGLIGPIKAQTSLVPCSRSRCTLRRSQASARPRCKCSWRRPRDAGSRGRTTVVPCSCSGQVPRHLPRRGSSSRHHLCARGCDRYWVINSFDLWLLIFISLWSGWREFP
jgi:hypothetical protein